MCFGTSCLGYFEVGCRPLKSTATSWWYWEWFCVRFYIAYAGEAGRDLRFDVEGMHTVQNSELADTIGNMVHRATGLCTKFCAVRRFIFAA